MRIIGFSSHHDDSEIFCSTLAKYTAQEHEASVAVMTRGDVGSPTLSREEIAAVSKGADVSTIGGNGCPVANAD